MNTKSKTGCARLLVLTCLILAIIALAGVIRKSIAVASPAQDLTATPTDETPSAPPDQIFQNGSCTNGATLDLLENTITAPNKGKTQCGLVVNPEFQVRAIKNVNSMAIHWFGKLMPGETIEVTTDKPQGPLFAKGTVDKHALVNGCDGVMFDRPGYQGVTAITITFELTNPHDTMNFVSFQETDGVLNTANDPYGPKGGSCTKHGNAPGSVKVTPSPTASATQQDAGQ